ncbi:hypothetical protein [Morganella morganii]|uniref:hypothetical protein n=1 Tax=Morganella morganii TaxID=582 RepID=UPI00332251F5
MSNPVISVMIAVHNAESSILAALESLDNALNENGSPEQVEAMALLQIVGGDKLIIPFC